MLEEIAVPARARKSCYERTYEKTPDGSLQMLSPTCRKRGHKVHSGLSVGVFAQVRTRTEGKKVNEERPAASFDFAQDKLEAVP